MDESNDEAAHPAYGLRALRAAPKPPPQLEQRVLTTLRGRGVLRVRRSRLWRTESLGAAIVAGLLLLPLGFLAGRLTSGSGSPDPAGKRWMLLLYEDEAFAVAAAGHDHSREYQAWAASMRQEGVFVDGSELADGWVLLPDSTRAVPDTLTIGGTGRPTGYFVIVAPSMADAARLAASSPHAKYDGTIVIRPLEGE